MPLLSISLAALLVGIIPCNGDEEYVPPPLLGKEKIQSTVLASLQSIQRWKIEYEEISEDGAPKLDGGIHRVVAATNAMELFHWSTKGSQSVDWKDDPWQQRLIISKNSMLWELPAKRFFSVKQIESEHALPGSMPMEVLWPSLGWWPFSAWETPKVNGTEPYLLSDVVMSPEYQLEDNLEEWDGVWCSILNRPGHGKIWFDSEKGCMLAREFYDAKTNQLLHRIELKDLTRHAEGVWYPSKIKSIRYPLGQIGSDGRSANGKATVFQIIDIKLNNEVERDQFVAHDPLPGSVEFYEDGSRHQAIPGGYDYFDQIERWLKKYVDFKKPVASVSISWVSLHCLLLIVAAIGIVRSFQLWGLLLNGWRRQAERLATTR